MAGSSMDTQVSTSRRAVGMIASREQAAERAKREVEMRRAAFRRLQTVDAEIEAVTERRVKAWGDLSRSASEATTAQIKALNERLTALWSEARALRACVVHGERGRILERAQRDLRAARSEGF
jgi:hypothetical protein